MQRAIVDINSVFEGKSYSTLISEGTIRETKYGKEKFEDEQQITHFEFFIGNDKYYFKISDNFIIELIMSRFIKKLGYDCVDYRVAKIDGVYGVISKNFKKEKAKYVTGSEVIVDYYGHLLKTSSKSLLDMYKDRDRNVILLNEFNNLEVLWQALEYRYRDNLNKDKIVSKLLLSLRDRFLLKSILLMDTDYYSRNWMIEENGEEINLAPIFDNEYSFEEVGCMPFGVTCDTVDLDNIKNLQEYLKISSEEDILPLEELIKKATPELFLETIEEVEKDFGRIIIKNDLVEDYYTNYITIKNILKERHNNGR